MFFFNNSRDVSKSTTQKFHHWQLLLDLDFYALTTINNIFKFFFKKIGVF